MPEAGSTLCRLPASGERPNSNRRQSASARNGGIRVGQAVPDGVIGKIFNHEKLERIESQLTTQRGLDLQPGIARDRFCVSGVFRGSCDEISAGARRLRQAEPDLRKLLATIVRTVRAARVWHEPRVTIIATREYSGLTFGSDLTGKSAASPNSV